MERSVGAVWESNISTNVVGLFYKQIIQKYIYQQKLNSV